MAPAGAAERNMARLLWGLLAVWAPVGAARARHGKAMVQAACLVMAVHGGASAGLWHRGWTDFMTADGPGVRPAERYCSGDRQ